jgi:hypothetical protein
MDVIQGRALWIAVLHRAIDDWRTGNLRLRRQAEAWLFHNKRDFYTVCRLAGIDALALRTGLIQRAAVGKEAIR